MRTGQLGSAIASSVSGGMIRARDGGILGFYVNGGTQGVLGLYDVATSASATASAAILVSATCPLGWNFLPVAFNYGLYVTNASNLPVTFSLAN